MLHISRTAVLFLALFSFTTRTLFAQQCCTGNVSTYCTSGTSVQGCVPSISGSGIPSVDAGSGFSIGVATLPGNRSATIFYGFYPASTPWATNSPSYLCVAQPVQRTTTMNTGATSASCNGSLQLDFNAWITANPNALGNPFIPGQTIRAQAWFRDPAAPAQTNLSNALAFTLCSGIGDTTPPTITTCASSLTLATTSGSCFVPAPDLRSQVVAVDNCSAVTIAQVPAPGTLLGLGTTPIVLRARDSSQNAVTCSAVLTVVDGGAPVILTCAANQTVAANSNCQALVPDFTASVVASDACGGTVTLSQSPAAGTLTSIGALSTPVTITATDAAGNTSSCVASLTVTQTAACLIPSGFVPIQPGTFQMGSNAANGAPYFNEWGWSPQPVHAVTISYPFWMGAKEVTQAEYASLMGTNPSYFGGNANHPVEQVTWHNARSYCAALTAQQSALGAVPAGYEYRLPTEAEWEYACRAGTTTEFNVGGGLFCNQARFWFSYHSNSGCNNSPYGTGPVGSYAPNAWGLYDMHGNVWEWCLDSVANYPAGAVTDPFVTSGPDRVLRGGGWVNYSYDCRSAFRGSSDPGYAYNNGVGFRVVLGPIQRVGFVTIQPGTFQMGEVGVAEPVHTVTISYPFWMGATEVTQAEYAALMGTNPSTFQGPSYSNSANRPVETVTWFDARSYCAALTAQQAALGALPSGYEFRLPTEAEWEYACRAGTTTSWNVGNSLSCSNANHYSNGHCVAQTSAVGSYAPNLWGLFDMHGNVWEWCLDSYAGYPSSAVTDPFITGGPSRVFRGGGWSDGAGYCRSAIRNGVDPGNLNVDIGFRVVLGPIRVP